MANVNQHIPVKSLTINTRKSSIIVRVLRLWVQKDRFSKETIEVIVGDKEGSRIQVTVAPTFCRRFKSLLEENTIVMIKNFETIANVVSNYQKAIINHPVKISVIQPTKVEKCSESVTIDSNCFFFTPFVNFANGEPVDENITVDVIGEVVKPVGIPEPVPAASNSRKLEFKLRDHGGYLLDCTLWESYADNLLKKVAASNENPVVMIIQFGKYSRWNNRIRVQSMRHATKIHFDEKIPEIKEFLKSLLNDGPTPSRSLVSNAANLANIDDYFVPSNAKTVTELLNCKEAGVYTVWAQIDYVDHESKWYYDACGNDKCSKGVEKGARIGNICKKCNKPIQSVVPRYKLTVAVSDTEFTEDGGEAKFVIFDRSVHDLLKISASQVLSNLEKYGDKHDMPEEFDALLEKQCLFRVEVDQKYNLDENSLLYTVRKLTYDSSHLQRFRAIQTKDNVISAETPEVNQIKTSALGKRLFEEFEGVDEGKSVESKTSTNRLKPVKKEKM